MPEAPKDDETKFNETLKRMLKSPPKPHKDEKHGKVAPKEEREQNTKDT